MNDGPPPTPTWTKPLLVFATVLGALFGATLLAGLVPVINANLVVLAAAIFVLVPYLVLRRQKADFSRYGIDLEELPRRQIALGLAVTALILPFFALGNHIWETRVLERQLHFDWDNYRQWSVELAIAPESTDKPTVQFRTANNRLIIDWKNIGDPAPTFVLKTDRPTTFDAPCQPPLADEPDTEFRCQPAASAPRFSASFAGGPDGDESHQRPGQLTFKIRPAPGADAPQILVGNRPHEVDQPVELSRNYWWLILWGLTHLLLIALPEEYFYRGYLQTTFGDLLQDESGAPRTWLGLTVANWLTSVCFALGHLLIPIGGAFMPARGAVFFPSLVFGWLRQRTGSIIASVVFHAGANMMVLILAVHYWP